jgi:hypothetical protein
MSNTGAMSVLSFAISPTLSNVDEKQVWPAVDDECKQPIINATERFKHYEPTTIQYKEPMTLVSHKRIPVLLVKNVSNFTDMQAGWRLCTLTEQKASYACIEIKRIAGRGASMRRRQSDRSYRVWRTE